MSQSAISMALTARAPGLEAAAHADALHHALDVGRVLPDQGRLELQHDRLQVGLGRLDLAPAGDALIGGDADDRDCRR